MGVLLSILLATSMVAGVGISPDMSMSQTPQWVLPETILVRVTGLGACTWEAPYKVVEMDFKEYVKGVLPAEWGNNWHPESLKAGAVAVKMYAWSLIEAGGKWHDADVYDCNFDQVYKPEWRTEATDRAVDETWNDVLVSKNPGKLIRTYYDNWYGTCLSRGEPNCMGQWNTKKRAEEGQTYDEMLYTYYSNSVLIKATGEADYVPVPEVVEELVVEATPETVQVEESYYTVKAGDSLSRIAQNLYGSTNPDLWMGIYEANLDILTSPNLINVGMNLLIPAQ